MADANFRNLSSIRQKYPDIYEAFVDAQSAINNIGQQTNAAPVGAIQSPPPHAANSVMGGGGKIDIKIEDPSPAYQGIERFADVSPDSSYSTFHTIHLGATHNHRGDSPVSGMAYVRTYSQYPTGEMSDHLYHPPVDTSASSPASFQTGNAVSGYGQRFNNSVLPPKR